MSLLRQALLALAAVLPVAAVDPPDIWATFHIKESTPTAVNNYYFRVWLDRPCSPTAVANFLGLVTGARAWIDPATGLPSTEPFYEGTQVYKVVPGIPGGEVCFGSPTNDGTGGPGYVFQDISLVPPGGAICVSYKDPSGNGMYQVYMENNGPNTNGSRFFISVPNQGLNDRYTRLGVVEEWTTTIPRIRGWNHVQALSNVSRDENGKPRNELTIESITIDGWDVDDPTFLIDIWDLPVVGTADFQITRQSGLWKLFGFAQPGAVLTYQKSLDLVNWSQFQTHVDLPGSTSFGADISADIQFSTAGFYRGASVLQPIWPATELDLDSATVIFDYTDDLGDTNQFNDEIVKLQFSFSSVGNGGTWIRWVTRLGSGTSITGFGDFLATYNPIDPFKGEMIVTPLTGTSLSPFTFRLHFEHHFPADEVIDRFEAFTLPPNAPESHAGTWRILPR